MKDLFIPYELAVIAKEKGFNQPCIAHFNNDHKLVIEGESGFTHNQREVEVNRSGILAPLYQQIVDWLRVEYKIYIYINPFDQILNFKPVVLFKWAIKDKFIAKVFSTYDQALNEAIKKAFKLI